MKSREETRFRSGGRGERESARKGANTHSFIK